MLNRRAFLARSAAALAAARIGLAQSTAQPVTVRTALGELRGRTEGGANVFRGVPFAEPPVGPLRFLPPKPARPWTGVREALHFSAAAMQPGETKIPQGEDCLYLNVWAPASGGPHPVFVWIHGGGFTGGRSFDPLSDGARFASEGIVCVTLAYRLGVFGFLDFGPVLGPAYAGGANHGIQDVVAALEWIQGNIKAFGGDPGRVTIGGESAGAKLTCLLLATPSAEGLFHQALSESGGADRVFAPARSAEVANGFASEWKRTDGATAATLRSAPARELIAAQERFTKTWPAHFPLRAEIDGKFLPGPPLDTIRHGSSRRKRLLIGTNRDESALFVGPHPEQDPTAADLGNMPLGQFDAVASRYAQLYPEMTAQQRRIRSLTAEEYWIPSVRVTDAHVSAGGTAFSYLLDFPAPSGRFKGYAFHSYDLRFVWEHFGPQDPPTPEEQRLADAVHAAWVAFIRDGAPRAPGMPTWPAYNEKNRPTMLLGQELHVQDDPQGPELAAWKGLLEH